MYVDYTGEKLKTNSDKIREKDPILFGVFSFQPDVLYYIVDWIDEYCDLTLDKLLTEIKIDDPEFELNAVPDIDDEYINSLIVDVKDRAKKLADTKASNYKDLLKKEADEKIKRKEFRDKIKSRLIPFDSPEASGNVEEESAQ